MKSPQKEYPNRYISKANVLSDKSVELPFQLIRCGFSNDRQLSLDADYTAFVLFYVLDGVAQYTKYKDVSYIHKNNIIISNCNTRLLFARATPEWKYFYVVFGGTHAKLYYNMIRDTKGVIPITPLHNIVPPFTELCNFTYHDELLSQMKACFLLHQIIHELVLATQEINSARLITPVQQTVVNAALRYIEQHYKEELSIDKICQKVSFPKFGQY